MSLELIQTSLDILLLNLPLYITLVARENMLIKGRYDILANGRVIMFAMSQEQTSIFIDGMIAMACICTQRGENDA